jgi:tetratricopeptide (TPR) repeat protein
VEKRLQTAVKLDPTLAKAHFQIGVLCIDGRRLQEAVAALQRAVRLEPGMAQARYRLGQVYRRMGQEDLAQKELEAFQQLQEAETAHEGQRLERPHR